MVGTLQLRELDGGAVVTTSFFSPGAQLEAAHPKAKISLVDYHELWRWIFETEEAD
jgi:hypothetical protein